MKFHLDNPLIDYINTLVSFVALNFIFLLCCIPVITIAPALTAMYTVTLHEVKGENGYIIRTYCREFVRNFGQPFVTGLFLSVLLMIVGFAAIFWNGMGTAVSSAAAAILLAAAVVIYSAMMYAFPLIARYRNSWKQTVKNALYMAAGHPACTIILLVMDAAFLAFLCLSDMGKIFMGIVGFSFIAMCKSVIFAKVFDQYELEEAKRDSK